jgi:hypothetical protein
MNFECVGNIFSAKRPVATPSLQCAAGLIMRADCSPVAGGAATCFKMMRSEIPGDAALFPVPETDGVRPGPAAHFRWTGCFGGIAQPTAFSRFRQRALRGRAQVAGRGLGLGWNFVGSFL